MKTDNQTATAPAVGSDDLFASPFPAHESVYVAAVKQRKLRHYESPPPGWGVFSRAKEWHRETNMRRAQAWAEANFTGIMGWREIQPRFRVATVANVQDQPAAGPAQPKRIT